MSRRQKISRALGLVLVAFGALVAVLLARANDIRPPADPLEVPEALSSIDVDSEYALRALTDFVRIGLPLDLVCGVLAIVLIPVFWPL